MKEMSSNFIPILDASPPPFDEGPSFDEEPSFDHDEEWAAEGEDFGGFQSAIGAAGQTPHTPGAHTASGQDNTANGLTTAVESGEATSSVHCPSTSDSTFNCDSVKAGDSSDPPNDAGHNLPFCKSRPNLLSHSGIHPPHQDHKPTHRRAASDNISQDSVTDSGLCSDISPVPRSEIDCGDDVMFKSAESEQSETLSFQDSGNEGHEEEFEEFDVGRVRTLSGDDPLDLKPACYTGDETQELEEDIDGNNTFTTLSPSDMGFELPDNFTKFNTKDTNSGGQDGDSPEVSSERDSASPLDDFSTDSHTHTEDESQSHTDTLNDKCDDEASDCLDDWTGDSSCENSPSKTADVDKNDSDDASSSSKHSSHEPHHSSQCNTANDESSEEFAAFQDSSEGFADFQNAAHHRDETTCDINSQSSKCSDSDSVPVFSPSTCDNVEPTTQNNIPCSGDSSSGPPEQGGDWFEACMGDSDNEDNFAGFKTSDCNSSHVTDSLICSSSANVKTDTSSQSKPEKLQTTKQSMYVFRTGAGQAEDDGQDDVPEEEEEDDWEFKDAVGNDDDSDEFGGFGTHEDGADDDFGGFSESTGNNFGGFANFGDVAGDGGEDEGSDWAAFPAASTEAVDPDALEGSDDDFADFEDVTPLPQPPQTDLFAALKKTGQLSVVLSRCFPSIDLNGNEITILSLFHHLNVEVPQCTQAKSKTSGPAPDMCVYNNLKHIDHTAALQYTWKTSHNHAVLLNTLNVDTRNILIGHKKTAVPIFATGLGLLEPTPSRGPADAVSEADTKKDCPPGAPPGDLPLHITSASVMAAGQLSTLPATTPQDIPPAEFDWDGSGLTNPLDSLENELGLHGIAPPISAQQQLKPLQPLEAILANMKFTPTLPISSPLSNRPLSDEANNAIKNFHQLAFMRVKYLSFPVKGDVSNDSDDQYGYV